MQPASSVRSDPEGGPNNGLAPDYGALFEALPMPTLLVAPPDFVVVAANEAHLRVTNRRAEEIMGRSLFDFLADQPHDPRAAAVANLRTSLGRVLTTGRTDVMAVLRYDIVRPEGGFEERWWLPVNVPVRGPDGAVRHIILQTEDITAEMRERRHAAQAEAGEARFRGVADAIPGLVFETDLLARNTYVNAQYRLYTGLPLGSLLGDGWRQVVHPDDLERTVSLCQRALRTGNPSECECRFRRADGAWRWFMLRLTLLEGNHGCVERAIGVCTDIDDAKRGEAILRDREEQFRTIADSLPQLAWMTDAKGSRVWFNKRWYEYTGLTFDGAVGWGWRKAHHRDHIERVSEGIRHAFATGEAWEDTFPLRGADGRYRWFLGRAAPLRDAQGRVTRWFGTDTDVSEQRDALELQRTLLQEVSHRVKNSLALVSSVLNLQAKTLDGAARRALEEGATRVNAVAQVHDQLWRQAGTREIDLRPFLCDVCAAAGRTAPQISTICEAQPAIVNANMAVPLGLFANELLTNAYKYAYPEGEPGEVRLSGSTLPDGRYRLDVVDRGRGLPPDFDLAKARDSLGVRVITSIAAQLKGEVTTGSAEPGARFTLVFPLQTE